MVGPQHNPSTEAIAKINHSCAAAEPHDVGQRRLKGQDKELGKKERALECFSFSRSSATTSKGRKTKSTESRETPYIVLLEEAEVPDDADPHKQGSGPKKYAADIITC